MRSNNNNNNRDDNTHGIDYSSLSAGDFSGNGHKLLISKYDFDLYDEAKSIPAKMIRIKRTGMDKTEKWRVLQNNELIFSIDGSKLSKKERIFLRSIEGMNFLIAEFKKDGFSSVIELKASLKRLL